MDKLLGLVSSQKGGAGLMVWLDWPGIENVEYECLRCHARFKGQEMLNRDRLACPECGYKIIKKVPPPIVKRVRAV
jgi:DNA-directed RNA polymerase subunit RPC12/RpoP